jgi:hypothetical protein
MRASKQMLAELQDDRFNFSLVAPYSCQLHTVVRTQSINISHLISERTCHNKSVPSLAHEKVLECVAYKARYL